MVAEAGIGAGEDTGTGGGGEDGIVSIALGAAHAESLEAGDGCSAVTGSPEKSLLNKKVRHSR